MMTIIKFFSGLFSAFSSLLGFLEKRKFENEVKNKYEQKKKTDALEEDKKTKELIDAATEKSEKARKAIDGVNAANLNDASLTEEQVKQELDTIEDTKSKAEREEKIKISKEIKEKATKHKAEIEKDEKFNAGEDITFRG